jgi:hypothetical protein
LNKHVLILLAALAILFSVCRMFGAGNQLDDKKPAAPAAVNIYDWFKIGEYADAIGTFRFNAAVYDKIDDTCKEIYDALAKARVSDSTLSAFTQLVGDLKAFPFDQNFQTSTKKDQETWKRFEIARPFYTNLLTDARSSIEAWFAYRLGYDALELAWDVPYYQENAWAESMKNAIRNAATDFVDLSRNADFKPLFTALDGVDDRYKFARAILGAASSRIQNSLQRLRTYLERVERDLATGDRHQALANLAELSEIARRLYNSLANVVKQFDRA